MYSRQLSSCSWVRVLSRGDLVTQLGAVVADGDDGDDGEPAISYETGRLYLRIIPSPFDEICSGHYKVTINVTKPSGDGPQEDKSNADAKSSARKSAKM